MAHSVKANQSTVIYNSQIGGTSSISNNISQQHSEVTPEMWQTLLGLAERYGKHGEEHQVQELKSSLSSGDVGKSRQLWKSLREFLQDFANVSQIMSLIDTLTR